MIFPILTLEPTLQVDDKTRLDGVKSYVTPDETAVTVVSIEPEASAGFIDVTSDKFLDWSYATEGTKTVTIMVTTNGFPTSETKTIDVISAADDKLFSADSDLVFHEPDILSWTRDGRSSFLDVHRRAQDRILAKLDELQYTDSQGDRLTKDAILDVEEVKQWSIFLTLQLVFEGLSNAVDDQFAAKAEKYRKDKVVARNSGVKRLDTDGSGEIENDEKLDFRSRSLSRS